MSCESLERRRLLSDIAWSAGVDLPAPRGEAMALSDDAGGILLFGGTSATGASNTVYQLGPYNIGWTAQRSLDTARTAGGVGRTGHPGPIVSGAYKYSSDIFLFGGKQQTQSTRSVENYGWNNDEGNITGPSMTTSRAAFAYASDPLSGDLYAIGGLAGSSTRARQRRAL